MADLNPQSVTLRSPQGERVDVPLDEAQGKMAEGWALLEAGDIAQDELRQAYDSPLAAFGAGALRGATFGLSDAAMRALGVRAETLSGLREFNPAASMTGDVTGMALSSLAPLGPLALLGRAGAVVGRGAQRAAAGLTGAEALSAAPRAAGFIARGAIEGAGIGAGRTVSEVSLDAREKSAAEVAQRLATGAFEGAAWGAGGAAAMVGASVTASALARGAHRALERVGLVTERTSTMLKRQRELQAEIKFWKEVPEASGAARLEALSAELTTVQDHLLVDKFARVSGALAGSAMMGGLAGAVVGAAVGPRLLEATKDYVLRLYQHRAELRQAWSSLGPDVVASAAKVVPQVRQYGPHVLEAVEAIAHPGPYLAQKAAERAAEGLSSKVGKARSVLDAASLPARSAALGAVLTPQQAGDIGRELDEVDDAQLELQLRSAAPDWLSPAQIDESVQQTVGGVRYLKQVAPRNPAPQVDAQWTPDRVQAQGFAEAIDAVMSPGSIVERIKTRQLTPTFVAAVQAVYPALLADVRRMAVAQQRLIEAQGGSFDHEAREQLALLQGTPGAAYSASTQPQQAPAGPSPSGPAGSDRRGRRLDVARGYQTSLERIGRA